MNYYVFNIIKNNYNSWCDSAKVKYLDYENDISQCFSTQLYTRFSTFTIATLISPSPLQVS